MRIPIIRTISSLRPLKRYLASATAARNAITIDASTAMHTTTRLFRTVSQKYARSIASRKWSSIGENENQVGVALLISSSGLNAVEIIQNTGKIITAKTTRPRASQPLRRTDRHLRRRRGPRAVAAAVLM